MAKKKTARKQAVKKATKGAARKAAPRKAVKTAAKTVAKRRPLTVDQAIIAVLIGSMLANDHVAPDESERAHHITWSMRRFRRRSGEAVGRLIENVRQRIATDGVGPVVQEAARVLPSAMRAPVLAVAADLVLVDGRLQRQERQFLSELARQLKVPPALSLQILKVISVKNAL